MKGELEERIRGQGTRPMQSAGIYDPMEQAGHADMVGVGTALSIIDECDKDFPTLEKALEKAKEWAHGGKVSPIAVYTQFVDMVRAFRKRWFGEPKK